MSGSGPSEVEDAIGRHPNETQKVVEFFGKSVSDLSRESPVEVLGAYYGKLLASPPLCNASVQMAAAVQPADSRISYLRELADITVGCFYASREVVVNHIPSAVAAGVPVQTVEALWRGSREGVVADDLPWIDFIESAVAGQPTSMPRESESWSDQERVEYVGFVLLVQSTACMMKFFAIAGPDPEEIEELLSGLR